MFKQALKEHIPRVREPLGANLYYNQPCDKRSVFLTSKKFLSLVDYLQATIFVTSTCQV